MNEVKLTKREIEILDLVAKGLSNRQIHSELTLSEDHIAHVLSKLYKKIGVENRAGAAIWFERNRLKNTEAAKLDEADHSDEIAKGSSPKAVPTIIYVIIAMPRRN